MAKKKKNSFWADFKAFITRGNVVDMAVGVVVGGAFSAIVTGLVNYIINPLIGLLSGGKSLDLLKTVIKEAYINDAGVEVPEVAILWGTWLQTIINFLLIALCIFAVLRIMMNVKNAMDAKKIEAEEKAAAEAAAAVEAAKAAEKQAQLEKAVLDQAALLAEIRDLMQKK